MKVERRKSSASDQIWSICQYYFTHNNGSSDDILLRRNSSVRALNKSHQNKVIKRTLQRSLSYPGERHGESPLMRRWTTIATMNTKRRTLSHSVPNLSRTTTTTTGNISDHTFESKWGVIRPYSPQLDMQRNTLWSDVQSLRHSYQSTIQQSRFPASPPSPPRPPPPPPQSPPPLQITMPMIQLPSPINSHEEGNMGPFLYEKRLELHSDKDMYLFLLGFLFFPLWWYGTYRYFTVKDVELRSRRQRSFQLLNYLLGIASLLFLGLTVGLATTWAHDREIN